MHARTPRPLQRSRDAALQAALEKGYTAELVTMPGPPPYVNAMALRINGKLCRVELFSAPVRVRINAHTLRLHALILLKRDQFYIIPTADLAHWLSGASGRTLQGFHLAKYREAWHHLAPKNPEA